MNLIEAFQQGICEESRVSPYWQEMPERLRARGDWLKARGRIGDAELMYDAACEIDLLRSLRKTS